MACKITEKDLTTIVVESIHDDEIEAWLQEKQENPDEFQYMWYTHDGYENEFIEDAKVRFVIRIIEE